MDPLKRKSPKYPSVQKEIRVKNVETIFLFLDTDQSLP